MKKAVRSSAFRRKFVLCRFGTNFRLKAELRTSRLRNGFMRRVLVIEDEPGLVMALTQRFRSEGYDVETAEDGKQGLALGLNEPFDVIVLDLMLPGRNGFDVCRDLRQGN